MCEDVSAFWFDSSNKKGWKEMPLDWKMAMLNFGSSFWMCTLTHATRCWHFLEWFFTGVTISLAHDLVGAWHWEAPKRFHCDNSNQFWMCWQTSRKEGIVGICVGTFCWSYSRWRGDLIFAEQIFGGVQIRRSQKKLMLIHICNQNPFTLILRYHYSIEELGGKEEAGAAQNP